MSRQTQTRNRTDAPDDDGVLVTSVCLLLTLFRPGGLLSISVCVYVCLQGSVYVYIFGKCPGVHGQTSLHVCVGEGG